MNPEEMFRRRPIVKVKRKLNKNQGGDNDENMKKISPS